jgi:hypothetical protein
MRSPLLVAAALITGACASASTPGAQQSPPAATPAPATPTTAVAARAALPADSFEIARKYTRWFYEGQTDSLVAHHVTDLQQRGSLASQLLDDRARLKEHVGSEVAVLEEKFITRNGRRQYWRTAKFSMFEEPVMIRWVIEPDGRISGLGMNPKSQAPPIDPQP